MLLLTAERSFELHVVASPGQGPHSLPDPVRDDVTEIGLDLIEVGAVGRSVLPSAQARDVSISIQSCSGDAGQLRCSELENLIESVPIHEDLSFTPKISP